MLAVAQPGQKNVEVKCPRCPAALQINAAAAQCHACGTAWPVRHGIPYLFTSENYWGEIPRQQATDLLDRTAKVGWRVAATEYFADNPQMLRYLLDFQRASWLALLGLDSDSVVLDIGSGYGAITDALSRAAGHVYSIEAIPERIQFTRLRLQQQSISNVTLIQGSALELPFFPNTFDLIVVNGILEWVGDWKADKDPKSIQIEFLKSSRELLKPNGRIMIGIENRIGADNFQGAMDHSGLRYTSLMPRSLASLAVRQSRRDHYRSFQQKRQYRTYTYSPRGYRKLLRLTGFEGEIYWAFPGYNEPYSLVPLSRAYEEVLRQLAEPGVVRRSARMWAKRTISWLGLLKLLASEFVILAKKIDNAQSLTARLDSWVFEIDPAISGSPPEYLLSTAPYSDKQVVRVYKPGSKELKLVVKATSPSSPAQSVQLEFDNLAIAHRHVSGDGDVIISTPRPIGRSAIGNIQYTAESAASGEPVSQHVFLASHSRRFSVVQQQLRLWINVAHDLAKCLRELPSIPGLPLEWRQLDGLSSQPVELSATAFHKYACYVQHGDFTAENLLQQSSGAFCILDWQHLTSGAPALYDAYTFLISLLSAIESERSTSAAERFAASFFGKGRWANLFCEQLAAACRALGLTVDDAWATLLQTLVLRRHYYAARNSGFAAHQHESYLQMALSLGRAEFHLPI